MTKSLIHSGNIRSASGDEETELKGHGADEAAGTQEAEQESAAEDEEPVPRPINGRARANGENGHARRHTDQAPRQETAQDHARQLKNRLRAIEEKSHGERGLLKGMVGTAGVADQDDSSISNGDRPREFASTGRAREGNFGDHGGR